MKIIVNHLTRMGGDRICVAGIDPKTFRHVRPVTGYDSPELTTDLLAENDGPLKMGAWIELGHTERPDQFGPPHLEDVRVHSGSLRRVAPDLPHGLEWFLDRIAKPSLSSIFGPDLATEGTRTCAMPGGCGAASLGVRRFGGEVAMELVVETSESDDGQGSDRLRLSIESRRNLPRGMERASSSVAVTALDFFRQDNRTIHREQVAAYNEWLRDDSRRPVFVMYGLTRLYETEQFPDGRHWLQVNGIYFG